MWQQRFQHYYWSEVQFNLLFLSECQFREIAIHTELDLKNIRTVDLRPVKNALRRYSGGTYSLKWASSDGTYISDTDFLFNISKKLPQRAFWVAILWMKNSARNKQIFSAPWFVTKSSRYLIKKTFFQSESKKTTTIVFRTVTEKACWGYFLDTCRPIKFRPENGWMRNF